MDFYGCKAAITGKSMARGIIKKAVDTVTFPGRALLLINDDGVGLSSLRTERFDYVARNVQGYCLDVGCGEHNLFVTRWLSGNGKGIDVFPYDGLTAENIVEDMSRFPFPDGTFKTATFIANINHIPEPMRDVELAEAYRCLAPGGNVVVTMGNPVAEVLVHKYIFLQSKVLGAKFEDTERGMHEDEEFYLKDSEIKARLAKAGFTGIKKKRFMTQWGLNHLFLGWKR
ncbi:MAG: class I SAM-dependent methyltransferase [SAR202 cluster bacterium]|nr:class I SAM-dependent methyltransferase [SAR202 cluster bacterium]